MIPKLCKKNCGQLVIHVASVLVINRFHTAAGFGAEILLVGHWERHPARKMLSLQSAETYLDAVILVSSKKQAN